ncbi:MAG: hypothetical protein GY756_26995 [bacterium]|nr:hypothetical protein [bacterium]
MSVRPVSRNYLVDRCFYFVSFGYTASIYPYVTSYANTQQFACIKKYDNYEVILLLGDTLDRFDPTMTVKVKIGDKIKIMNINNEATIEIVDIAIRYILKEGFDISLKEVEK